MCSDMKFLLLVLSLIPVSCGPYRRVEEIRRGDVAMTLSVADEPEEKMEEEGNEFVIDSIKGSLSDGPLIMKAIKDSETGEMVATDIIQASKVMDR